MDLFIILKGLAVVAGAVTATAGAIKAVAVTNKWLDNSRAKRIAAASSERLSLKLRASTSLSALGAMPEVSKVLLIEVRNGGGKPKIGSSLKATVLEERFGEGRKPIMEDFQRFPLPDDYLEYVLIPLVAQGEAHLATQDLPEGLFLRDLYEAEKVERAFMVKSWLNNNFFYFVVAELGAAAPPSSRTVVMTRLAAEACRRSLEAAH